MLRWTRDASIYQGVLDARGLCRVLWGRNFEDLLVRLVLVTTWRWDGALLLYLVLLVRLVVLLLLVLIKIIRRRRRRRLGYFREYVFEFIYICITSDIYRILIVSGVDRWFSNLFIYYLKSSFFFYYTRKISISTIFLLFFYRYFLKITCCISCRKYN